VGGGSFLVELCVCGVGGWVLFRWGGGGGGGVL